MRLRMPSFHSARTFRYPVSTVPQTPILDLEQAPPKPPFSHYPVLIGIIIGLVAGLAPLIPGSRSVLPQWHWPSVNPLLLIPALYAAIAAHETGHFLAGRLAGLNAGGISVGPFVFLKSGATWLFRFDRGRWLTGFLVPLAPPGDSHPSQYVWLLAGGPLASLALAVLTWLFWKWWGDGAWNWAGTLFLAALVMAVSSALPASSGVHKSDCLRLWHFVRHPRRARAWMALVGLQTEDRKGIRPRDWNAELFERSLAVDSAAAGEYVSVQVLAHYRRLDEGRDEAALEHLENALRSSARAGKALRHGLFLEAAWASAGIRKQAAQARTWYDRARKLRKPQCAAPVDGAIAMCEGRYEEAERHWQEAQAWAERRKLDSGLFRFAKERWANFEAACREMRGEDTRFPIS